MDPDDDRPTPAHDALASVASALRCPACGRPMRLLPRQLICSAGHTFDLARQGYVNLTSGRSHPGTGDTATMVAAREQFLAGGHYARLAALVAEQAAHHDPVGRDGLIVEAAGGTGYYLAAILDRLPDRRGVCLDLSAPALRRAARTHPRAAAVGADVWQRLPLATGSASTVVSIFGPRNAGEVERLLTPDGVLIVASPAPEHLQELIAPLGLIGVDPAKPQRQAAAFARFEQLSCQLLSYQLALDRRDIAALVGMGPSATHLSAETAELRARNLPSPTPVTVAVQVATYARGQR